MTAVNAVNGPPLTTEDLEEVLLELNKFEKSPSQNIPNLLERYMIFVAKTGCASFPWSKVKPLFRAKLENVIVDFSSWSRTEEIPPVPNVDVFNFSAIRTKVFEQLDSFAGIPFTVQRLAELLTAPRRHYKRTDKFMRALEKNMLIVSTVEARANNNNEAESSNSTLMNGDYLSNGNGKPDSNDNNGTSASTAADDLANSNTDNTVAATAADDFNHQPPNTQDQEFPRRDNVEDELDAEMTDVNPNADSAAALPEDETPQPMNKPEDEIIKDEMITDEDEDTSEKTEEKIPDQSDNESQNNPQDSDQQKGSSPAEPSSASTVSNEAEVSHDQKEPEEEEAKPAAEVAAPADTVDEMEVENTPAIADSSSSTPATVEDVEEKIESPTSSEDNTTTANNVAVKEETTTAAIITGGGEEKIISSSADDSETIVENPVVAASASPTKDVSADDSAPESSSTTTSNEASVSESM